MDQKHIAKQMIEFNKTAFDNSFSAMSALQDQTEKLILSFLDKAAWFPQEGKTVINDWVASYKKGRVDFKSAADESYKKVADYFAQAANTQTGKSGKK
ncbi:MAG: hypothetical protein R6W75_10720 [Smithellaceae bacterium]